MAATNGLNTFRQATFSDARDIDILLNSTFSQGSGRAGYITEYDFTDNDCIDATEIVAKITQENGLIVVAHNNSGKLVGCCEIQGRQGGFGYYGLIAMDASRQGSGLGRRMLTEAEELAKKILGIRKIETRVDLPRQALIDWYIRRGKL